MSKPSFEKELITKIVDTGDLKTVTKFITADHFLTPVNRQIWSYISGYYAKNGCPPSREMLSAHFPKFEYASLSDPLPSLADKVHERYVYNAEALFLEKIADTAQSDPKLAAQLISESGGKFRAMLNAGKATTGVDLTQQVREEIDEYYRRKTTKGVLGIPWPWPRLNRATFGIQDGQLILFYARPKNMKTFVLLYTLQHIYYHHGRKPILFTREMSVPEMRHRILAMYAQVDYDRYLTGTLTNAEEKKWKEALETFEESPPFIVDSVSTSGEEAADEMIAKAQEYGADLMGVDGIYLFGNREWDQIAAFTSRLKQHLLNTYKIPCLGTTQGNRDFSDPRSKNKKDTTADMGFSDSLGQDCDVAIKVAYSREDERIYMSLPAVREGKGCEFQIWAKPCTDFSQAFAEEKHTDEVNMPNHIPDPSEDF